MQQPKLQEMVSRPPDIQAKILKRDSKFTKKFLSLSIQLFNHLSIKQQYLNLYHQLDNNSWLIISPGRLWCPCSHLCHHKNVGRSNHLNAGPLHRGNSRYLRAARTTNLLLLNLNQTIWIIVKHSIQKFRLILTGDPQFLALARAAAP